MSPFWINLAGWLPAVFLPLATLTQLVKIIKSRSAEGVSILTWLLFGFANLGIYLFTEKYFVIQSILAQLLTAMLNFIIVLLLLWMKRTS